MNRMKKILMVFDGRNFYSSPIDFVRRLNGNEQVLLTGLFLPSFDYVNTISYYLGTQAPVYIPPTLETEELAIEENIAKFRAYCSQHNIAFRVHKKIIESSLESIRYESRFSDLLVICSELFYNNLGETTQREYLHDTTHNAECPVLLLPNQHDYPESIILAYDGSATSIFAIKQFAYLFPQLTSLNTILIYATGKDREIPDLDYIKEYLARHFSSLSFMKLDLDPKKNFTTWLENAGHTLLVSGSGGRSLFSEMFRHSFVSEVIREHSLPVFVCHRK